MRGIRRLVCIYLPDETEGWEPRRHEVRIPLTGFRRVLGRVFITFRYLVCQ